MIFTFCIELRFSSGDKATAPSCKFTCNSPVAILATLKGLVPSASFPVGLFTLIAPPKICAITSGSNVCNAVTIAWATSGLSVKLLAVFAAAVCKFSTRLEYALPTAELNSERTAGAAPCNPREISTKESP